MPAKGQSWAALRAVRAKKGLKTRKGNGKKPAKKNVRKRIVKKTTRRVRYRFPGIDRSLSKRVYELESKLALTERKTGVKNGGGKLLKIYAKLSAANKRTLLTVARSLK